MKINKGSLNMQMPRLPFHVASVGTASVTTEASLTWTKVLAASLLIAYLLRITIPAVWLSSLSPYAVNFSGYFVLVAAILYFLANNLKLDALVILLVSAVVLTIFFSVDFDTAVLKGSLWVLVFIVVGPLLSGLKARLFRDLLWRWHKMAMLLVTLLSFVWYVARLPQYGKGVSGITLHCMLLGPFAGLALICATVKTIETRSYKYGLIAVVSLLTCLVSGSRSAALGAVTAVTVIPILRIKGRALRWASVIFLVGVVFFVRSALDFNSLDGSPVFKADNPFERYIAELQQKGMANTREQLWKIRWAEFESSPIVGLGIGVDTSGGSRTEYGTTVIEPGSSYLALLSMTGIIGLLSVGILMVSLVMRIRRKWALLNLTDKTEIAAVGMFWAIHALAEGWIFAGGSILCLFFWLWVGRLSNLGSLTLRKSPAA